MNKNRQSQILSLIKRFINFNSNIITDKVENANYIMYFIDKDFFEENSKDINKAIKIGELSNCYILLENKMF